MTTAAMRTRKLNQKIADLEARLENATRRHDERTRQFNEQKEHAIRLANERDEANDKLLSSRMALHGMEIRAQRAEATAEMLHAQLYPQPRLPWQKPKTTTGQYVGNIGEFRIEE